MLTNGCTGRARHGNVPADWLLAGARLEANSVLQATPPSTHLRLMWSGIAKTRVHRKLCPLVLRDVRRVLLDDPPTCPLDRRDVSKVGLEKNTVYVDLRKLLGEAGMRCPNYTHGCDYVLTDFSQYDNSNRHHPASRLIFAHLEAHYPDCKFHKVSCEACGTPVVSSKIVEHMKSDCKGSRAPGIGKHQGEVKGSSC